MVLRRPKAQPRQGGVRAEARPCLDHQLKQELVTCQAAVADGDGSYARNAKRPRMRPSHRGLSAHSARPGMIGDEVLERRGRLVTVGACLPRGPQCISDLRYFGRLVRGLSDAYFGEMAARSTRQAAADDASADVDGAGLGRASHGTVPRFFQMGRPSHELCAVLLVNPP
jgi:hypothetical protein